MNLPRFAVRHPIFVIMVSLIVIILGIISLSRLPIDLMPEITLPRLSIYTDYENASPEEVEELVTRLIEEAVSAFLVGGGGLRLLRAGGVGVIDEEGQDELLDQAEGG